MQLRTNQIFSIPEALWNEHIFPASDIESAIRFALTSKTAFQLVEKYLKDRTQLIQLIWFTDNYAKRAKPWDKVKNIVLFIDDAAGDYESIRNKRNKRVEASKVKRAICKFVSFVPGPLVSLFGLGEFFAHLEFIDQQQRSTDCKELTCTAEDECNQLVEAMNCTLKACEDFYAYCPSIAATDDYLPYMLTGVLILALGGAGYYTFRAIINDWCCGWSYEEKLPQNFNAPLFDQSFLKQCLADEKRQFLEGMQKDADKKLTVRQIRQLLRSGYQFHEVGAPANHSLEKWKTKTAELPFFAKSRQKFLENKKKSEVAVPINAPSETDALLPKRTRCTIV